jgi:hypothetical protein
VSAPEVTFLIKLSVKPGVNAVFWRIDGSDGSRVGGVTCLDLFESSLHFRVHAAMHGRVPDSANATSPATENAEESAKNG